MKTFDIRFEGFYDSIHSQKIDMMIESYFSDENGEPIEQPDNINYQLIMLEYSKLYVQAFGAYINDEFDISIKFYFDKLYSPREYNFRTDSIITDISDKNFNKLKSYFLKDDDFIKYVNESSKSRDGFSSFYDGIEAVVEDDEILLIYIGQYIINDYDDSLGVYNELETRHLNELLYQLDFYKDQAA